MKDKSKEPFAILNEDTEYKPMTATEILYEELYKTIDEIKVRKEIPFKKSLLGKVEKIITAIYLLSNIGEKLDFDRILEHAARWRDRENTKHEII